MNASAARRSVSFLWPRAPGFGVFVTMILQFDDRVVGDLTFLAELSEERTRLAGDHTNTASGDLFVVVADRVD